MNSFSLSQALEQRSVRLGILLCTAVAGCFLFVSQAHATVKYWIGTGKAGVTAVTVDRFEDSTNWSLTSKGIANTTVPTAADVAVFTYSGGTVRLRSRVTVLGLVTTNTWTGSILQGTGTLNILGSGWRVGSGTFVGSSANINNSGSLVMTGGIIRSIQGNLNLSGALSITSVPTVAGLENNNSKPQLSITGSLLLSPKGGQTNITIGRYRVTSVINNLVLNGFNSGSRVYSAGSGVNLSGSLTVNLGTLDMTRTLNSNAGVYNQPLVVKGGMTIADSTSAIFKTANNMTISGSLTINTNAGWTATGATTTFNSDNPQTLTLNGIGRRFQRLIINNTGNGSRGNVIVAGGGLFASGSLTVTAGKLDLMTNLQTLSASSGTTITDTLKTASNMFLSGSLSIGASATVTVTGGTLTFNSNNPQTVTIANSNQRFNNITINNTAGTNARNTVTFVTNPFSLSGSLTVTQGTFDASANAIASYIRGSVTVADSSLARLLTTAMTLSGSLTVKPAGTFTQSAGTMDLDGSSQTLSGAMTFYTLQKIVTTADTLSFYPGYTYTVTNSLLTSGVSATSKILSLISSITGSRWTITPPIKTTIYFAQLKDSYNTRLTDQLCLDCTDNGNNLNWAFESSPSVTSTGNTSNSGGGGGGGGGGRRSIGTTVNTTTTVLTTPGITKTITTPANPARAARLKGLLRRQVNLQKQLDEAKDAKAKKKLETMMKNLQKAIVRFSK